MSTDSGFTRGLVCLSCICRLGEKITIDLFAEYIEQDGEIFRNLS